MASTYLELTNRLLRRLNEVEIDPSNFDNTRGVQTMAKDAIQASVNEINEVEFEWPFNATSGSQILVVGQSIYSWPANLKTVDWNSFRIAKDDTFGITTKRLTVITTDQWNQYYRDNDEDAVTKQIPIYVFRQHGYGFGVSPNPDKAYTVEFDYWLQPVQLVSATDTSTIPTSYEEAIIQGGLYHFYMFRDNIEQSKEAENKFRTLISRMRTILVNPEDNVSSTVLPRRYGAKRIAIPISGWYM